MDIELILFGIIPIIISLIIIVLSFILMVSKRVLLNTILFAFNFSLNGYSIKIFIHMCRDAYPSILPHLLVVLTIPILIIQFKFYKKYR